jgi:hypothetical protein
MLQRLLVIPLQRLLVIPPDIESGFFTFNNDIGFNVLQFIST